jgi:hypothetical protein
VRRQLIDYFFLAGAVLRPANAFAAAPANANPTFPAAVRSLVNEPRSTAAPPSALDFYYRLELQQNSSPTQYFASVISTPEGLLSLMHSRMEIFNCFAELGPMLVGHRSCYQSGILHYIAQLNRPIAVHTFGGRGSPAVSSLAA